MNAIYREYWFSVKADDLRSAVVLSSNDCHELKQVTIVESRLCMSSSYSYVGVSRESGVSPESETDEAKSREETSNSERETTECRGLLAWLCGLSRKSG